MLFGISGTELMVILVITLVLVGPDKLPDYARKAGRFIHSMRVRGQALSAAAYPVTLSIQRQR